MNEKQSLKIVSVEGETSFCFHEESGSLFDCGEGAALFLSQDVSKIKRVFLSDSCPEHTNGLRTLIEKSHSLEIFYPEIFAPYFNRLEFEIGSKENIVWTVIKEQDVVFLDENESFLSAIESVYNMRKTFAYKMVNYINKLKPQFRNNTPQENAAIKKGGIEITYHATNILFLYSVGKVTNPDEIKDSRIWVCGGHNYFAENKSNSHQTKRTIFSHFRFNHYWPYIKSDKDSHSIVPPILISNKYVF